MIGYLLDGARALLLQPQVDLADPSRTVALDPDSAPVDTEAQTVELVAGSSRVVAYAQGSLEWRHEIVMVLQVQHGDPEEADRRRDRIVADLTLRWARTRRELLALVDPLTGQYGTDTGWTVSYAALDRGDPLTAWATMTLTVDTTLDL